ncbi:hypothetical protein VN24_04400 [Paenibacillus beijingensis]|uniref:DUF2238 domain-containing protein n=2 Tax=Paenibacillus beijingensis TaxID=1126833 RepID=A0A0D5NRH2_9BACL|nr:hypothetical protein VN24_04400 [Paenibacillus beijingensis]
MIAVFLLIWGWLAFWPVVRRDWLLENIPLAAFIVLLAFMYRKVAFSNLSYLFITIFFILHTVGAHYAYQVPLVDDWFRSIFQTKRGVYDRLVHLAFGLLILLPMRELALRVLRLGGVWAYAVPFAAVLSMSGIYEISEMWVALLADPKLAAQYLGLKGDPLDTAKDMSMTLFGVLIACGLIALIGYIRHKGRDTE